ncbi:MAG TPA: hypothetical protein VHE61_17335 [Opitutaceae bacterium]|nr:hypothetical protein [Opitutaceae bacterium]
MHRFLALLVIGSLLLTGCGTTPTDAESTREVVLQYVGTDVGTAGPFGKGGKKELTVLTQADRQKADALIDGGASAFTVYGTDPNSPDQTSHVTRVVLVQHNKIVGDFKAPPPPPAAPAPAQPASTSTDSSGL